MCSKKISSSILSFLVFISVCASQTSDMEMNLLQKLDSLSQGVSISKHFATLYYNTTSVANHFFSRSNENVQSFMQRLENRFGNYYLEAVESFQSGQTIPEVWQTYFSDTTLSKAQYFLLGANAHINGDIWKALTTEFSLQEIQDNKREYFNFYNGLKKIYEDVYRTATSSTKKAALLHSISFGLDKVYGEIILKRWRKRQMQLAILYFTNKKLFTRKLHKLNNKMHQMNRMICKL